MRYFLMILLAFSFSSPSWAGELQPFPGVKYSSIKAYYFNAKSGPPECSMPLNKDGSLCSSVEGKGKQLSKRQAKDLFAILNDPASYQTFRARCFTPHHAFVLYNAKGKAVGEISLCFDCDHIILEPATPSSRPLAAAGLTKLRSLCRDLGLKACDE